MGLPNPPYNVKELFRFNGSGVDLFFFSLTALSLGWGTAWAGRRLSESARLVRDVPLIFFQVTGLIYALLWLSVTRESIMDIAGSSVFVHRVTERAVMGEFGVELARIFGTNNLSILSNIFEPIVRFGALVGPLLITLGITFGLFFTAKNNNLGVTAAIKRYFYMSLVALPWLYFCKVIAFDWSSTDNLNELIARDGIWGLGGGGYLYLLLFCICILSVLSCLCIFLVGC